MRKNMVALWLSRVFLLPFTYLSTETSWPWRLLIVFFSLCDVIRFILTSLGAVIGLDLASMQSYYTINRCFLVISLVRCLCLCHATFYSKDGILVYHPKVTRELRLVRFCSKFSTRFFSYKDQ